MSPGKLNLASVCCVLACAGLCAQPALCSGPLKAPKPPRESPAFGQAGDQNFYLREPHRITLKDGRRLELVPGIRLRAEDSIRLSESSRIPTVLEGQEVQIPAGKLVSSSEAERLFRGRLESEDTPGNAATLGRYLLEIRQNEEALRHWEKVTEDHPDRHDFRYALCLAATRAGRYAQAEREATRLIDTLSFFPTTPSKTELQVHYLRGLRGRCALARGDFKAAYRDLQAAARAEPDHLPYRLQYYETLVALARIQEAASEEHALRDLAAGNQELLQQVDDIPWRLAASLWERGRVAEARRFLPLLDLREPRTPDRAALRIELNLSDQRYDRALKETLAAQQDYPDDARFYCFDGLIAFRHQNYEQSLKPLTTAIKTDPGYILAYRVRGYSYLQLNRFAKAVDDFATLRELDESDPRNGFQIARCQLRLDRTAECLETLRNTVDRFPEYAPAWNLLAWVHATHPEETYRNGPAAVRAARKACNLTNQQSYVYLDTLAAAYAEAGQFAEARRAQIDAIDRLEVGVDHAEFQQRLELYRNEQPYREGLRHQPAAAAGTE